MRGSAGTPRAAWWPRFRAALSSMVNPVSVFMFCGCDLSAVLGPAATGPPRAVLCRAVLCCAVRVFPSCSKKLLLCEGSA